MPGGGGGGGNEPSTLPMPGGGATSPPVPVPEPPEDSSDLRFPHVSFKCVPLIARLLCSMRAASSQSLLLANVINAHDLDDTTRTLDTAPYFVNAFRISGSVTFSSTPPTHNVVIVLSSGVTSGGARELYLFIIFWQPGHYARSNGL